MKDAAYNSNESPYDCKMLHYYGLGTKQRFFTSDQIHHGGMVCATGMVVPACCRSWAGRYLIPTANRIQCSLFRSRHGFWPMVIIKIMFMPSNAMNVTHF
jgi:hypothetical protein